jgi:hypothetical protein
MTEYLPHGNYEGLADALDEVYHHLPEGPFRDAVVDVRTALKSAAEADNGETERARLKIAQDAFHVMRGLLEDLPYDKIGPEHIQILLTQAQQSLERGFASREASRRNDRAASGLKLSLALALCLTV